MSCPVYHLKATCCVTGLLQVIVEQRYLINLKFCLEIKKKTCKFHVSLKTKNKHWKESVSVVCECPTLEVCHQMVIDGEM